MLRWIGAIGSVAMLATSAIGAEVDDVTSAFAAAYPRACSGAFLEDGSLVEPPAVFDMTYRMSWQDASEPDRSIRLYQYQCAIGAYNVSSVFFTVSEDDGIRPLQLAQPTFAVTYERTSGGEENDQAVDEIALTGMTAYPTVTNAEVDAASGTIRSNAAWRGIGDASSTAEWRLMGGDFTLVRFDVDASYDGEVNPENLWDTTAALGVVTR